ncbi:23897_t:CDS:2, partial [Dentiscutata erythropus]
MALLTIRNNHIFTNKIRLQQTTTLLNSSGGPSNTYLPKPGFTPSQSSSNNTSAIVGGVIGFFIFVSVIAVAGFMLYRRHRAKMFDPLIDINNQTCSDTNHQDYSDMKHQ